MEFTLYYRGQLKANRGPKEKHALRRHFHRQLAILWTQPPLPAFRERLLDAGAGRTSLNVIVERPPFRFAPLVAEKLALVAELDVLLLRPEPPGRIVVQSGDIDNRIKTLLDALKVPREPGELPPGEEPGPDEDPLFCLLEDDALITRLSVRTERLLEPGVDPSEAVVQIHVRTKQLAVYMGTIGLA